MIKSAVLLREHHVVMVGEGGVGKSAITIQFTQSHFLEEYDPTIEDSYRRQCLVDEECVMLDILDTAGQEDYSALRERYMRNGEGFILVYSITSLASFERIQKLYEQITRVKDSSVFPIILVGNKSDLNEIREVSTLAGKNLAKQLGCQFLETSAKNRLGIEDVFQGLVRDIRRREKKSRTKVKRERKNSSEKPDLHLTRYCCNVM